jgi:glycosyltransferase involved in cell wall biosynthesis
LSRTISVSICTRNRPQQLARALASVVNEQTLAPAQIIVVDSAPADNVTEQLLESAFPQVTYVREEMPGIGYARNRALKEATGDVVAFIDDDAVADQGWVQAIARAMHEPEGPGACTGLIEALSLDTAAQQLFEANGGFGRGRERIELPKDAGRRLHGRSASLIAWAVSIGNGCNLSVDRRAALAVGGFDGTFGCCPALPGGEDLDLLWRLIDGGMAAVYEPAALVRHEHRRTMAELERQLAHHQRGLVGFLTKAALAGRGAMRLDIWLFLSWRLVKPGLRLLRRLMGRDPLPAGILWRMWWNAALAPGAYFLARRRASGRRSTTDGTMNA